MTLDEIKRKVEERNKSINVEYEEDEGLDYCKRVLQNNDYSSIEKFLESNVYDACKCLYYICNEGKKSMEESRLFIDPVSEYFMDLDESEFRLFYDMLFYLAGFNKIDKIVEYLEEDNNFKAGKTLKKFNFVDPRSNLSPEEQESKNKDHYALLKELRRINKAECNIVGLFEETYENPEIISLILGLISVQKRMQQEKEAFLDAIERKFSIKRGTSASRKYLKDYFKNTYKTKSIISDIDKISEFVTKEEYNRKNHEKLVDREIKSNEQAFNMLTKESQNDEIKDAKSIVKRVKDEELKNMFLNYIYEHNMKYYVELNQKLELTRENSVAKYLDELKRYRIVIDANEVRELMKNSLADFKEILLIINRYVFEEADVLRILKTTNLELVKKIDDYVKDGIININFVKDNILIFDVNSKIINTIDGNVNLLARNGINPKLFINSLEILLCEDNTDLVNNIKLLDDYQLKGSLKTTDNYLFLLDPKLADKIDKLIELGFVNYLDIDLNLLNSCNLKRLEVLKAMNIPITSIEELRDILNRDKFIMNDSELDEYIPNVVSYKDKLKLNCSLEDLENYRLDDRTYSFNGVLISSNKVKRLIDNGYDVYEAIFHNTLLSEDEYKLITEDIKGYCYKI